MAKRPTDDTSDAANKRVLPQECDFCRRQDMDEYVDVECLGGQVYTLCDGIPPHGTPHACSRCHACLARKPPTNPTALLVVSKGRLKRGLVCEEHLKCEMADLGDCKGELALVEYLAANPALGLHDETLSVVCETHRRRCDECKRMRVYDGNWTTINFPHFKRPRNTCPHCLLKYRRSRAHGGIVECTPGEDDPTSSDDDNDQESSEDDGNDELTRCAGCDRQTPDDRMHTASLGEDCTPQRVCAACLPRSAHCGHCMERFLPAGCSLDPEAAADPDRDTRIAIHQSEFVRMMSQGMHGPKWERLVASSVFSRLFYHWHECAARCDTCQRQVLVRDAAQIAIVDPFNQQRDDKGPRAYRLECVPCESARRLAAKK